MVSKTPKMVSKGLRPRGVEAEVLEIDTHWAVLVVLVAMTVVVMMVAMVHQLGLESRIEGPDLNLGLEVGQVVYSHGEKTLKTQHPFDNKPGDCIQ